MLESKIKIVKMKNLSRTLIKKNFGVNEYIRMKELSDALGDSSHIISKEELINSIIYGI